MRERGGEIVEAAIGERADLSALDGRSVERG